ncbi:putative porin, partial [Paraburkholderia sp. GAS348]
KFGGLYAFSNNTDFTLNRAYSAGASYDFGPFTWTGLFSTRYPRTDAKLLPRA